MKFAVLLALFAVAVASPEAPLSRQYGPPALRYGPPSYRSSRPIGSGGDPLAQPASYQFNYKVQDAQAGLDFGHQEQREGEQANGQYYVLLPDGRLMTVTYVANENGYHPEIRFEESRGAYTRGHTGSNGYY